MGRVLCGFMKGMATGLLAGGIFGAMAVGYMHKNRRGLKRNVGHALRTVGDLTDSVLGML